MYTIQMVGSGYFNTKGYESAGNFIKFINDEDKQEYTIPVTSIRYIRKSLTK